MCELCNSFIEMYKTFRNLTHIAGQMLKNREKAVNNSSIYQQFRIGKNTLFRIPMGYKF